MLHTEGPPDNVSLVSDGASVHVRGNEEEVMTERASLPRRSEGRVVFSDVKLLGRGFLLNPVTQNVSAALFSFLQACPIPGL